MYLLTTDRQLCDYLHSLDPSIPSLWVAIATIRFSAEVPGGPHQPVKVLLERNCRLIIFFSFIIPVWIELIHDGARIKYKLMGVMVYF